MGQNFAVLVLPQHRQCKFQKRQISWFVTYVIQDPWNQSSLKFRMRLLCRIFDRSVQFAAGHGPQLDIRFL